MVVKGFTMDDLMEVKFGMGWAMVRTTLIIHSNENGVIQLGTNPDDAASMLLAAKTIICCHPSQTKLANPSLASKIWGDHTTTTIMSVSHDADGDYGQFRIGDEWGS